MKKIIALLFLFVFCFSCAVSLAEEPVEITYQDIPWFSSPEEASSILIKEGFLTQSMAFGEKNINNLLQAKIEKYGFAWVPSNIGVNTDDPECPYSYCDSKRYTPITKKLSQIWVAAGIKGKIADKRISAMGFYFTMDEKNRQLVEILIGCRQASQDDILKTLEEAYGKATAERNNREYVWLGANNTIIIYHVKKSCIVFATLDGLNQADAYDIEIPE